MASPPDGAAGFANPRLEGEALVKNGQLKTSDLQAIPGGRLAKGAPAKSWIAMRYFIAKRTGGKVWIRPTGPNSSYRSLRVQQAFFAAHLRGGPLAAKPGTSRHGLGLACDTPDAAGQRAISVVGEHFGWAANRVPGEPWHMEYVGGRWLTPKARVWYWRYRAAGRK